MFSPAYIHIQNDNIHHIYHKHNIHLQIHTHTNLHTYTHITFCDVNVKLSYATSVVIGPFTYTTLDSLH
ncbi:hypothetical protein EON63_22925 [archaeon]|nr:MAG: hypothetical protein EON63_22925 [archaeon]